MKDSLNYSVETQQYFMVLIIKWHGAEYMLSVVLFPIDDLCALSGDASNLLDFVGTMQYIKVYKDSPV